eukprot:TRINITY_DN34158_c0_g1_i1.p1 TRINITY_DN34158_c0_g1~~TRINITY_DN34158_c0_g1_i1.p1  ORF type:complete len:586 (-),score=129.69 TRINITY_DN34158_c0_g1_i1:123-1823(-)
MSFSALKTRLGTARLLLEDCTDERFRPSLSAAQKEATQELLRRCGSFDAEQRADILATISRIAWHCDDGIELAKAVSKESSAQPVAARLREPMQNYSAFSSYFTAVGWELLRSPAASYAAKLELVICRLARLGCRNPTEPTSKLCSALLLLVSKSWEEVLAMTPDSKQATMQSFKNEFKRQVRFLAAPRLYIKTLPTSTETFLSEYPDFFAAAFDEKQLPVACQVDWQKLQQIDMSFCCRGVPTLPAQSSAMVPIPQHAQVERIGSVLMAGMTQMAQQQQQFMQFCMGMPSQGQRLSDFGCGQAPRIQIYAPKTHGEVPDARIEASPESNAAEQPSAEQRSALLSLPPPPTPESTPALQTASTESSTSAGARGTLTLIHLLESRNAEKAREKARLAKKAKVGGDAKEADADGSVAERLSAASSAEPARPMADDAKGTGTGACPAELAPKVKKKSKKKKKKSALGKVASSDPPPPIAATKPKKKARPAACVDSAAAAGKKASYPSFSMEHTRSQVMCRNGLRGPGSTCAFKWGEGRAHATKSSATKAAKEWVKKACVARGLTYSPTP